VEALTRDQAEARLREMADRILELRRAERHGDADALTLERDAFRRATAARLRAQET
jgi:hypothetical protein